MNQMAQSLPSVNFDVLTLIVQKLDFRDVVSLSLTCRQLYGLIHEETLCHSVVESHKRHSAEADEARSKACTYLDAFRKLYKRQASFATAAPFSLTELGYAYSFCLENGIICWSGENRSLGAFDTRRKVQIQPPQNQAAQDIPDSRKPSESLNAFTFSDSRFGVLSYLNDIAALTACCSQPPNRYLVLIVSFAGRDAQIIAKRVVRTRAKVFVRQSPTHIVYGFNCDTSGSIRGEEPRWTLEVISLANPRPNSSAPGTILPFHAGFGHRIGIDVEFAIHNGRFFAVSTTPANNLNNDGVNCYFNVFSISLSDPTTNSWRTDTFWRRSYREGPANDPWTRLQLQPCETSGTLMLLETRQEWVNRSSTQVRSCYMYPLLDSPDHSPLLNPQDVAGGRIHHDCDIKRFSVGPLRHTSYNLSAGAFIDVGLHDQHLRIRVSAAAKTPVDPTESKRKEVTGRIRTEELIMKSIACRSYVTPFKCAVEHDATGLPSVTKPEDYFVEAAVDERSIVLLVGHKNPGLKQLVLVSFDPTEEE